MHPKTIEDLSVSKDDVQKAEIAFHWMLALSVDLLEETVAAVWEHFKDLPLTPETLKLKELLSSKELKKSPFQM
jgi:hypothetical protein